MHINKSTYATQLTKMSRISSHYIGRKVKNWMNVIFAHLQILMEMWTKMYF